MNPRDFLRAVAAVMPGPASATRASQLSQLAPRLGADFRPDQLTVEAADEAGRMLKGMPTYPELHAAVREAVGMVYMPKEPVSDDERWADMWETYIRRRLGEGSDPAHLMSLLRAQCPPAWLDRAMSRLFPHEHAEMHALDRERRVSKGEAVARAIARAKRMPSVPESTVVHIDPPAPRPRAIVLSPERLAEARAAAGIVIPERAE